MNAFACIRCIRLFQNSRMILPILCLAAAAARISAQEACVDGCRFPDYPGIPFTLGDGFVAKGGPVTVTHMGFLKGGAYNNDGSINKIGLPTLIGELYFLDPVTGQEKFLFTNQNDYITHENDSGKVIDLGFMPKGAPIVFKYKNITGSKDKQYDRFTGTNEPGVYDFNADPVLKNLAINGKPKPRSGGSWNWSGIDHFQWAIAGMVPGTDIKQFQFEDLDDRRFNDIVFRVSGVALTSESFKLDPPALSATDGAGGSHMVSIAAAAADIDRDSRIFYTLDGSPPKVDSAGAPQGTTREYLGVLPITETATVTAIAWKAKVVDDAGNTTRYIASDPVSATYQVARQRWSTPTATPPGGPASGTISVSLAQAEGARMYYHICQATVPCEDPTTANTGYTGVPFKLTGRKVLKVIAIQSPRENSEVATFLFSPVFKAVEAVYLDTDGDGRIETARIGLDAPPDGLPASVHLLDPFAPGKSVEVPAADLAWDSPAHTTMQSVFGNHPFTPGTGFDPAQLGFFTDGGAGYDAAPFKVRDGAGPVVLTALAEVSLDSGSVQRLTVKYSEALDPALAQAGFPLRVARKGGDITADLEVSSVESLGDNTFRYTFSSPLFPIPGDSLRATALAKDRTGNPSNMSFDVEVRGEPLAYRVTLAVSGGGCVKAGAIPDPRPLAIPISVTVPADSPSDIRAGSSCLEPRANAPCLDCLTREWLQSDPRRPEAGNFPDAPEIKVTTRLPFTFDLAYFSTLGELVNRAKGEVTEGMLQEVTADAKGYRTVALRWYPVSAGGTQAATGAYIVKGWISTRADASGGLIPGVPVAVPTVTEQVLMRFGYVRK